MTERPVVDLDMRVVRFGGKDLRLPRSQFNLIAALARHPGHVMTRYQLIDAISEGYKDVTDTAVCSVVKRARSALVGRFGRHWIARDWGTGYYWEPDRQE